MGQGSGGGHAVKDLVQSGEDILVISEQCLKKAGKPGQLHCKIIISVSFIILDLMIIIDLSQLRANQS